MAEALLEVRDGLMAFESVEQPLSKLNSLYVNGIAAQNLQEEWTSRGRALEMPRLETTVLSDLRKAVVALRAGRIGLVLNWVERTEARFLEVAERYENLVVTENEVTIQSVLLHRFFLSGVECWLEALALLGDSEPLTVNAEQILEKAIEGQRKMVLVAILGQEMKRQKALCFRKLSH